MGLDLHTARWLTETLPWPVTRVLTVGRQNWWLSRRESRKLGIMDAPAFGRSVFSDFFWDWLDVPCESVDISPTDNPTHIADLGAPGSLAALGLSGRYNTVIDIGTAEHVANQTAYWENLYSALTPNGELFAMLPADGLCGHGLYQFSPEFFGTMGGFVAYKLHYVTYGLRVRWRPAECGRRRFQRKFMWPTYVAAQLIKTGSSFSMPRQFNNGETTHRPPPGRFRLAAVELPGIRLLERVFACLQIM